MTRFPRRQFLSTMPVAALASQKASELVKPRALRPGDTVGLITPSTYVSDPDRLWLAQWTIEQLGLRCRMGRNVGRREGYLAGTVRERVEDLHAMFADPEVKAVFCVRGGYGAAMLLDSIDYGLIRRNPKIFVGYSDITALHLAIHRLARLVTFHGPVVLSGLSDFTIEHFRRALFETKPLGRLANPPEPRPIRPRHPWRAVRPGRARGPLVGGNLTLISTTLGTPYEIQTEGAILFLEDVGEEPYSIDRMLTHLRLAGKLRGIRGLIFGECSGCRPREFQPGFESTFSTGEVVQRILGELDVPVLSGLVIGHTDDQLTLPLGVMAELDADAGTLTIEEAAVVE
ncbi:MAG: peptidase U61 [Bryobacteraceae bacterium]|nr:MAG: peptidase U61 [Bryobacteraceae bacterium]